MWGPPRCFRRRVTVAKVNRMGAAEGNIIPTIITLHITNVRKKSVARQSFIMGIDIPAMPVMSMGSAMERSKWIRYNQERTVIPASARSNTTRSRLINSSTLRFSIMIKPEGPQHQEERRIYARKKKRKTRGTCVPRRKDTVLSDEPDEHREPSARWASSLPQAAACAQQLVLARRRATLGCNNTSPSDTTSDLDSARR